MTSCPYCKKEFINVNPSHLAAKHDKRLADVYKEFPGWDIGKTSKGAILGRKLTSEHRRKLSEGGKGRVFTKQHRSNLSKAMMGKPNWRKGIRATIEERIANSARQQGVSVEEWKGFSYNKPGNEFSKSPDWKKLRLEIKHRDKFRCGECTKQFQGRELEVHHILPRRERADLILEPTNCITLCKPCHRRITWREHLYVQKYSKLIEIGVI